MRERFSERADTCVSGRVEQKVAIMIGECDTVCVRRSR